MANKSYDESHIERRYFIDENKYNCPYCNIRSINYWVDVNGSFDWTRQRKCYYYIVICDHCKKKSLHFSNYNLYINGQQFTSPPRALSTAGHLTQILKDGKNIDLLDGAFFYHQPTTFFTIDNRIPEVIRELISEAEGCRKMNYLVGASGCLRKAIYELLKKEKIPKEENKKPLKYEDRIEKLKQKLKNIEPEYFDTLGSIQGMTSSTLHEGEWESFSSPQLTFLIETTKEILCEIYVIPDERKDKKTILQKLKEQFTKTKSPEKPMLLESKEP